MHHDQKYIEALRRNDPSGIREIYTRFSKDALLWIRNNNGTSDDARDIFQEAVVSLYEKAQHPDFVLTCPLGAMLYVLYSRKWIDRLRAKKKEARVRIEEESRYKDDIAPDMLELVEQIETENLRHKNLSAAFSQLSELCQQLLRLLSEGIPPSETAVQLQFNSVDTLYRRKNACASRWRELYLSNGQSN